MVRLRYAGILHEETDNVNKAEDILNKGVRVTSVCFALEARADCFSFVDNVGTKSITSRHPLMQWLS
jgi:hypothetical protein